MGENPKLSKGDDAPEFEAESDDSGALALSDFAGQKLVLYFYPRDMTPGCTTEACDFRDNLETFQEEGWQVVGVSPDEVDDHEEFRQKYDLNFPLLADTDNEIAKAYGVWREKQTFGNTYEGIVRSTFLIDEDGEIIEIFDNVRATGHVERLLRDMPDD
jgi:peroxiredoxin Q/BCP